MVFLISRFLICIISMAVSRDSVGKIRGATQSRIPNFGKSNDAPYDKSTLHMLEGFIVRKQTINFLHQPAVC